MKFALFNNERIEAKKGAKGVCPSCGSGLIAKCGEVYIHHWAHKKKCDDHWWENETEWHRNWKNKFPEDWQEIIHRDESGEKHIADVKTSEGWAIEFQHSYLDPEERRSRDNFYNKLIWVVDGTRRPTDVKQFQNLLNDARFISNEPFILRGLFPEDCRLIQEWGASKSLVLLDFGNTGVTYNDGYSSGEDLWLIYPSNDEIYISSFSRNSFIELLNHTNSDEVLSKLINPIKKELEDHKAKQEKKKARQEEMKIIAEKKQKERAEKATKEFLKKMGRKPVDQKVAYVIGICRNRFNDFDRKVASTTLNSYVKALNKFGYSDEQIVDEFDIKVIPKTIKANNWTEWKNLIELWQSSK